MIPAFVSVLSKHSVDFFNQRTDHYFKLIFSRAPFKWIVITSVGSFIRSQLNTISTIYSPLFHKIHQIANVSTAAYLVLTLNLQ